MKSTHFINTLLFMLGLIFSIQPAQAGCGGPGVFNVFSGGSIEINNPDDSRFSSPTACNVSFSGSDYLNVTSDKLYAGKTSNGEENCGLTPTGSTLDKLKLPKFPNNTDNYYVLLWTPNTIIANPYGSNLNDTFKYVETGESSGIWKNMNKTYTSLPGRVTFPTARDRELIIEHNTYGTIESWVGPTQNQPNTPSIRFRFDKNAATPFVIDKIEIRNQSRIVFDPGVYFIRTMNLLDYSKLEVSNLPGEVKIYILNSPKSTVVGNNSCINVPNCDASDPSKLDAKRLQIYVYNNNFEFGDVVKVAASIYVHDGDLKLKANSNTVFAGEALAKNIVTGNNNNVQFIYQDTGVFTDLYAKVVTPRAGEYSLAAPAVPDIAVTGDYAFIVSQTEVDDDSQTEVDDDSQTEVDDDMDPAFGGHLKAYAFQSDGTTSSTAAWDANTHMMLLAQAGRALKLYSNTSSGTKALISALGATDYAAFGYSSVQDATLAATKSIAGPYMATFLKGDWNTIIGLPNGAQPLIYKDMVLFTTSDGYLYAVDRSTGTLQWGWMPRPLLSGLQDYETFLHSDPMQGQLSATVTTGRLEDKTSDDTINPKTGYVLGTAKGGAIHYGLNINSDGSLGDLAWIDARQANDNEATTYAELTASSPNAAAPVIFTVSTGDKKALYIVNNKLVIRPVTGGRPDYNDQPDLGGNVITSTPLVARKNRNVIENTLYVGDNKGYVWSASLSSTTKPGPFSKISNDTLGDSAPVRYISIAQIGDYEYLVAQSDARITVFKRLVANSTSTWSKVWTSTVGSATEWKPDGTTETNTTLGANTSKVQPLPTGATLKSKVAILGGIVFAPVTIEDPQACTAAAYEYLFNLENGYFPPNSLYGAYYKNSKMLDNLYIGIGQAFAPQSMIFEGKLTVQGHSEQNATDANRNSAGGLDNPIELRAAKVLYGRRGWKELIED